VQLSWLHCVNKAVGMMMMMMMTMMMMMMMMMQGWLETLLMNGSPTPVGRDEAWNQALHTGFRATHRISIEVEMENLYILQNVTL
jgi:hypothetical protein